MPAVIYFHPEAYSISGPKLMGRNAAGESFLRGLLAHSRSREFWAQVERPEHAHVFAEAVQRSGRTEPVRIVDKNCLGHLADSGLVYCPEPGIGRHAWQRALFGDAAWSLCGITHTTSSAGAMDAIANLLVAPVQPWDAVICTSPAVKENLTRLLGAQAEYLTHRLGAQSMPALPQFPVIPLGVHANDYAYTDYQKDAARSAVEADAKTHVVLFMGRLSFHAKAHPLAMYQALEKATGQLPAGESILLLECGWHANEYIENAFSEAAALACPSVRVLTMDGRDAKKRETAWASADVFCSLSDNIQETFGITPVEAMAAGLPVIVSNWDGYRSSVRDGLDGFLIPTLMPGAGLGGDLALRHALEIDTYDMYCGNTCSLVAVDVDATAKAFVMLFCSRELRKKMGEAGRQRAHEVYDWSVIIPQYETLWAQLGEIRAVRAPHVKQHACPWPGRMDPFSAFTAYPTDTLTPQTLLGLVDSDVAIALERVFQYRNLKMVNFAKAVMPAEEEIRAVLSTIAGGPMSAIEAVAVIPSERRVYVFRALAWLAKMHIVKVYGG